MIENRAVCTNDDIQQRKHVPQGKKVKLFYFFFNFKLNLFIYLFIFGKINKNI